jgi:hypothetical protein
MPTGDKPIYSLQCDIAGCGYEIRCNDGPLLSKPRPIPVTVELPLNAWIHSGTNRISATITPPPSGSFDEDTEMEFQVYRKQDGESRESRTEISKFSCKFKDGKPDTATSLTPKESGYVLAHEFPVSVPFSESQWINNLDIPEDNQSRERIFQQYLSFHQLLRTRNIEAVIKLLSARTAELAGAFYEPVDEQRRVLREQFMKLFGDPSVELRDIPQTAVLKTYGSGKLARLELKNGESPIYYLLTKFNVAQYVSLMYTQSKSGEWIIIR